jgi:hypothetical protein
MGVCVKASGHAARRTPTTRSARLMGDTGRDSSAALTDELAGIELYRYSL